MGFGAKFVGWASLFLSERWNGRGGEPSDHDQWAGSIPFILPGLPQYTQWPFLLLFFRTSTTLACLKTPCHCWMRVQMALSCALIRFGDLVCPMKKISTKGGRLCKGIKWFHQLCQNLHTLVRNIQGILAVNQLITRGEPRCDGPTKYLMNSVLYCCSLRESGGGVCEQEFT